MDRVRKVLLFGVLFLVIFLGGCTQQGGQEKAKPTPEATETPQAGIGVPVYSGSKVYAAPTFYYQLMGIPEGVTLKVYYTDQGSVREILEWYRDKLKSYEILQDIAIGSESTPQGKVEWGGELFKKGNEVVGIWAMSGSSIEGGKGAVYFIAKGPAEAFGETGPGTAGTTSKKKLPSADLVSGEEPVNRYPGSVMLTFSKEEGYPAPGSYLRITYGTSDSIDKVVEWFKTRLSEKGWKAGREEKGGEAAHLEFSKDGERLYIDVYAPDEEKAYTTIDVSYSPNRLPTKDQVSGEEPVKRYPGSVMLEYTSTTVGGGEMITITYGSNDGPEKVFGWYVNELKGEGWQIMQQSSGGGTFSISAFREGSGIQIEISSDGYTEISLMYTGVAK